MEYNFGTAGADTKVFKRVQKKTTSQPPCLCPHENFVLFDGKYICNTCGAYEVIPEIFNYMPDESQLTKQPSPMLCNHEPIMVNKPSSNTPICTTCGAYLELANVYKPRGFPLTETQHTAFLPHCAYLLNMENTFHQMWNPDNKKTRRNADDDLSAGTEGSLTEMEKAVHNRLLKGARGGCVVMIHDTRDGTYLSRVISNCGTPKLQSVLNPREVLEYHVFSAEDLNPTPIQTKTLNRDIKRCFDEHKHTLLYLASYLVQQIYTRYNIVAVSIKLGKQHAFAVRPGYEELFIGETSNELAWISASPRRIVAPALIPSSAQEAFDLLGCLSGSLPRRPGNKHVSRFWLLHGKYSQDLDDRSPRHCLILSLVSLNSNTSTSRLTARSTARDEPPDNSADVESGSHPNHPSTTAAVPINEIEQNGSNNMATPMVIETDGGEIPPTTSATGVHPQESASVIQESNVNNTEDSSTHTTMEMDEPVPSSTSTEPRVQPTPRLVINPNITPVEIQTNTIINCTVALRYIEPMSTHFVVTIEDSKKVSIVKVTSEVAEARPDSFCDLGVTRINHIRENYTNLTFNCNCGTHSSSGNSASCYATEFLKLTLQPQSRLHITYSFTQPVVQHLPTCWSVLDQSTSQVAIIKIGSRRNANSSIQISCSNCRTDGVCTHKETVLDTYLIDYRESSVSSEPVVSQSPIKFNSANGEFEVNRDDLVSSRGSPRRLFLVNDDDVLLYGTPQEFKRWQAANAEKIVPCILGKSEPCHVQENASQPPLKQQFLIFDIGGAALVELELCTCCGKSRTLVDECYDLFIHKGRSVTDKVTVKNKFGIGITMALARHFALYQTHRQCLNDLFIRLDTILTGDDALRYLLEDSFQYCFTYKKLQTVLYAALASCNIMDEVCKGSCLHRHNNEIESIIFDVVWIGQNAGYMPDSAFSVTRPTGEFSDRNKQTGNRYSRTLIVGDESEAGQLRSTLMNMKLIDSTEAPNINSLKNVIVNLKTTTDTLNRKLPSTAHASLDLFIEVLDRASGLLQAIENVDANNTTSGLSEVNTMMRLFREIGTYSTVTCIMNDTTRAVIAGFISIYPHNSHTSFPLDAVPNELFEYCKSLWNTARLTCQDLIVAFFKFAFARMDAVQAVILSSGQAISAWDQSKLDSSKLSKQNPIDTGLISLVPPVNDVYSYKGDRPGQTTKDDLVETCNKNYLQSASSGGRLGLMLGFCGDCGNLLIVELLKTEGRRDVFDLLQRYVVKRTEEQKLKPVKVYYDFMCGLTEFAANRDPHMFQYLQMFHDKFHAKSHSQSCSGWLLHKNDHMNTEIAEQANSILAGISNMLGRCGWIMGMFNLAVVVACFNKVRNIRYEQELKKRVSQSQSLAALRTS